MQRAGATERHEREASRIDTALHGHDAQGAEHLGIGDGHDAGGAGERAEAELMCEPLDRGAGRAGVEGHPAGERAIARQVAEQQVGVGDRRPLASASVAGGPGLGPGRLRTDAQRTARVAPCDRAPAGADGVDVEHRQRERPSADAPGRRLADRAALDDAHVAGGATHVEAEHVVLTRLGGEQPRPADASRRAREHGERGVVRGQLGARRPAGRLHDLDGGQAVGARAAFELAQVVAQQRRERGVDLGRRGALELAERPDDLVAE